VCTNMSHREGTLRAKRIGLVKPAAGGSVPLDPPSDYDGPVTTKRIQDEINAVQGHTGTYERQRDAWIAGNVELSKICSINAVMRRLT
jgi:hypothetical protein